MGVIEQDTSDGIHQVSIHSSNDEKQSLDSDAQKLAEMGYIQDMKRNFSMISVLGVGFSLTNSWFAISAALITGINSGGPVLIIYGIILVCLISTCVGISLSELASAMPNAGGQYFWANELAPRKYSNFASYLTGWFAWAGAVFTSAAVALAVGSAIMGCIQLAHPSLTIEAWMVVVAYQICNILCFVFNCYGKALPTVATLALWISLISFFVILVVVPATAPSHETAKFVFATFVNNTGWKENGIAFIVGLINTNWAFACLDCATHMAEEVARPEKMIPIAIMGTVAIGFVTSWSFSIAIFFSVNNLDAISSTSTLVPILELFHQALQNKAGAIVLECLIIMTGVGCLVSCHTWQSRLCWSFARDRGLPASGWLSKVHRGLDVPLNAHTASSAVVAALGFLYLGSSNAFNSMVSGSIVLLYISYSIPVACLLAKGRSNIRHGPFWMGALGHVANYVLLAWTGFTLVMYSFPSYQPVEPWNTNYVCAVYVMVVAITLGWWWIGGGRKKYRNRDERHGQAGATLDAATHVTEPVQPRKRNRKLDPARNPERGRQARAAATAALRQPSTGDPPDEKAHDGREPAVPLEVAAGEEVRVHGQVAVDAGEHGGGHLAEAEHARADDLPAGLEGEAGQRQEGDEVRGGGGGRGGHGAGLDEGGGGEDEQGLRAEGGDEG